MTISLLYKGKSDQNLNWTLDQITDLIIWATKAGMSDIILNSGDVANIRVHGAWHKVTDLLFDNENLLSLLQKMSGNNAAGGLVTSGADLDFGFEIQDGRLAKLRYRGNATPINAGGKTGVSITLRTIPSIPPSLDELGVEADLQEALFPGNGLILMTGVMGSGKSTLLAAALRYAAENFPKHISTYEAPIEFNLTDIKNKKGPLEQSEVPRHLRDFLRATRNSTRRAPDIVLIGESRDAETLRGMLESAEIGVAAYSTVHTRSVAATPTRIINVFDQEERSAMASSLIKSLRVIIQQRLYPKVGGGRVAAREYLIFNESMREKLVSLPLAHLDSAIEQMVQTSGQSLEKATLNLLEAGLIERCHYDAVVAERNRQTDVLSKVISIEAQASVLRSMSPEKIDETIASLADRYSDDLRAALARLEERSQAEELRA